VSRLVGATLWSGEPIVVAGTRETREGIAQRLRARGIDLKEKAEQGQYTVMDAEESLSQFMRDGRPDAKCLADVVEGLNRLRLSSARGEQSRLTIFGEMAVFLYRSGNVAAAVEVEQIWNELTKPLPFFTVCSYPLDCFHAELAHNSLPSVWAEHVAVTHA
jgi:hypothetical protein